jgi:formyl-CoA transferase
MGASFLAQNSDKRSIVLDLKQEEGKASFKRLVELADVVLENFRPGVMERLGLGHQALSALNPRLIYCAISGFGQRGPLSKAPAYDQIIQGLSGLMSITGSPDTAPLRVGYPACDTTGGLTAAFAICAALVRRSRTGQGAFIDVSMLDATLVSMGWVVSNLLIAGQEPRPMGNDNFTASPSGTFRAMDRSINISANKQEQFEALCDAIGASHLKHDPRFADREMRKRHRAELTSEIEARLALRPAQQWVEALNAASVPSGAILTMREALAQPQVAQRELIATLPVALPERATVQVTGAGFSIDGEPVKPLRPPPRLGEHSEEILQEIQMRGAA